MQNFKLRKIMAITLISTLILALNPIGVSAEWKHNSKGWWYANGNSYDTGWKFIDHNWYYFYSNGYMAHDTTIDGYYLNSDGAWTNSTASNSETNLDSLGQEILANISTQTPSFNVKYYGNINDAGNVISNEINNIRYTNPYYGYNISSYNILMSQQSNSSTVNVTIDCKYKMTAAMEASLDAKAKSIVSSIAPNNMSQSKKELAIHDWIINNTKYDQTYSIYDPYNTLIKHTGVCEGYSLLAQKMFTLAGIKSLIIEGKGNGQDHAWNLVYIDGKWRHVDLTWDDPVMSDGSNTLKYDYFNLTDREISTDHSFDTSKYPSAN